MNRRQRVAHVVALVVTGVCLLAPPTFARDCPELVGRLPGPIDTVAVSGDYAYLGGESGLFIVDVSDPSVPRVVGDVGLSAQDVAVSGSYSFVAAGSAGLRVIDVSDPTAPVEVGSTQRAASNVAVSGDYAYVTGDGVLQVIDVSTPSAPAEVGSVDAGAAQDLAVSGGYVYVTGGSGLKVIDVSTPSAPRIVGELPLSGGAQAGAVSDGYAYVATADASLRVIDVSTPSEPLQVGIVDMPGSGSGVAVSDGYAYVSWLGQPDEGGLRVIDVRTPSAPGDVGFLNTRIAWDVAVEGGYAYLAGYFCGLCVIDVSTPSAPVEVGFLRTVWAHGVAVSGGYAYITAADASLRVIDVSTPSAPVEVGRLDEGGYWGVAVSGGYAYVTWTRGPDGGFGVVDVRTPSAPVEVGSVETPGWLWDVALLGNDAYVVDDFGLRVIDVHTPAAPWVVGELPVPSGAGAVAVSGSYAYVAAGDASLRVIDVNAPSAPVEVGFIEMPDYQASDIAVSGDYAYVVGWSFLSVIDVSTPSVPAEVGFLDMPGSGEDVAVSGGYAYVADREGGLRVIDVSSPSTPVEVGLYNTVERDPSSGIAISDGYVFLSAAQGGLYIFRECEPLGDPRESFIPAAAVAAGAQGAFFQTDVEVNNTGVEEAQLTFQWLPRGQNNSEPIQSEPIGLAPGQSLRYENVLTELFGLGPDSLGSLKLVASTSAVIGMSRTYNVPAGKTAGTFGQGLPAIRATEMIKYNRPRRIIFLSEDADSRANVGCVNGTGERLSINIALFDAEGTPLDTRTMTLGPYSNNQINRVFEDYAPVNGYVDVWADGSGALYYCYGSMLDNFTSDPTTILPQVPSADVNFIPAAALAAGLEGAFFSTDVDLNNAGSTDITYELLWLPRGADNSEPVRSEMFSLAPGAGVRYANVLDEVFGLEPDQVGGVAVEASGADLLAMSRTYNVPSAKIAGSFGQELPGIPDNQMIPTGVKKRIIFMNENDDVRSNVGCQNAGLTPATVTIELHDSDGERLGTRTLDLPPFSNDQITRVFRNHAPISAGYVDLWTDTPDASIYCYGSVLDNLTSDPTTVLPQ
jgi:hypothetical protein